MSFFLGQVSAKIFAEHLLQVPALTRVDEAMEAAGLPVTGSRPDFYGVDATGGTFGIEAKGRSGTWTTHLQTSAKAQAAALPALLGLGPFTPVAHMSFFYRREWRARLVDPPKDATSETVPVWSVAKAYYQNVVNLIVSADGSQRSIDDETYVVASLPQLDAEIGLRADLYELVSTDESGRRLLDSLTDPSERAAYDTQTRSEQADVAKRRIRSRDPRLAAAEIRAEVETASFHSIGADGVVTLVGPAWDTEVMHLEPQERPGIRG